MKFIFTNKAVKQFKKLDKSIQQQIKKYTDELEELENPRSKGKNLKGNLAEYWRYRVENYRLICMIQDDELIILCFEVGHRSKVYK